MSDKLVPASKGVFGGSSDSRGHALENGGLSLYRVRELLKDEATAIWSGTMDIVPDHNRTVQTAFPIASIIKPDQPGAYLVLAEDAADATPEKEFTAPSSSNDQAWGWRQDDQTIPAHWVSSPILP